MNVASHQLSALSSQLSAFFARFTTVLGAPAAERIRTDHEIVVRIRRNARGGFSIYPANDYARRCFGGDEPAGNFGTYTDAWRVAVKCNEWTVTDEPALLTETEANSDQLSALS